MVPVFEIIPRFQYYRALRISMETHALQPPIYIYRIELAHDQGEGEINGYRNGEGDVAHNRCLVAGITSTARRLVPSEQPWPPPQQTHINMTSVPV